MSSQSVLVIGGGLAGLACAVALAEAGLQSPAFRKASAPGRARHVLYAARRQRSRQLPARDARLLHEPRRFLPARGRGRRRSGSTTGCISRIAKATGRRYQASALPPPLHMAPSFLGFGALGLADKAGIAQGAAWRSRGRAGSRPRVDGVTMLDWLHRMRQTPDAIERFWRVVLVSALDEELSRMDARYGIDVFWKAFLGKPRRISRRDSVRAAGGAVRGLPRGRSYARAGK